MKSFNYFMILVLIFGCTGEKSPVNSLSVLVSKEQAINFGELGLSSTIRYPSAPLDSGLMTYLIYNPFFRRLDSLLLKEDQLVLVEGRELEIEGPSGIPEFNFFTMTAHGPVYLDGNQAYLQQKNGETIKINFSRKLGQDSGLKSVFGGDSKNKSFRFASVGGDFFAVLIKDFQSQELSLVAYDFLASSFSTLPFSFSNEQMKAHRIAFQNGPMTVENAYYPYLSVYDSTLVISYPFFNQISTVSLKNNSQKDFTFESKLFKTVKDLPEKGSDFKDIKTYLDFSNSWNSDVNFGSVLRLNKELYFRVVEEQNSQKVFLELFSKDFEKLGEYDLTAIEPNLGTFHLPLDGKILFSSSKKESEDIFNYHWVSLQ